MRRWLLASIGVVIGLAAIVTINVVQSSSVNRQVASAPPEFKGEIQAFKPAAPPKPAPELAFSDKDGKLLQLADFRGRVLLINLWATWCSPCVREMPALDRLQAALGGPDFAVLAISTDRAGAREVAPFFAKQGLKHLAIYLDPKGATPLLLEVRGLPTTILIDREGRELGRLEGPADWDKPAAMALIRHYIEQKPRVPARARAAG